MPIFMKIAKKFSNSTHIGFGKIDITENEIDQLSIQETPTI
jgi:hypothetical protein